MKIDVKQIGWNKAYKTDGTFISNHSTYRVALEVVVNLGGGYVIQPKVEIKVIETDVIPPNRPIITKIQ